MIITRHLQQPCPFCGESGEYGNVSVSNDTLFRGCNKCGKTEKLPLPRLTKKIIYLDQFFLSHAFRDQQEDFVNAAKRIQDLTHQQIVVCPWSDTHEFETHLWRHSSKSALWQFIKQTARGHRFSDTHHIRLVQMKKAFESFLDDEASPLIDPDDAFYRNPHKWNNYVRIDLRTFIENTEKIRSDKEMAVSFLVDSFDEWASSENTFAQDVLEETNGCAKSLMMLYLKSQQNLINGEIMEFWNDPVDSRIVEVLMNRDSETLSIEDLLERIWEFFNSRDFRTIPYIDISCRLYAILRKRVREGQFSNREKAKKTLSGFFYDVEAISVFGPYSDAIFIDRAMHQWLKQEGSEIVDQYSFRLFSAENWEEFFEYLDEIEENCPEEVRSMIPVVYPELT